MFDPAHAQPPTFDLYPEMESAKDLLWQVRDNAVKGSIQLEDVEKILSNDEFTSPEGLLTTTDDGVSCDY